MSSRARTITLASAMLLVLAAGAVDAALAQTGPFGVPHAASGEPAGGWLAWAFAKQAEFYRSLSTIIRAAKADGSAVFSLLGISFLYGIFHAAGPGHGKAVISSYLVANDETWRRGIALSFAAAMIQSLTAVVIVVVAAGLLGTTAKIMGGTVRVIEIASYLFVTAIGARLLWVKGWGFLAARRQLKRPRSVGAAATPVHHAHGDHHHHDHHSCRLGHSHCDHDHGSAWSHAHGPEPDELAGPDGWRRGLSAVAAVGLRPCSGAIIVLVFALAQELFWAGVGATFVMGLGTAITVAVIATLAVTARSLAARVARGRAGYGILAMRGIEAGAAAMILLFGVLLLTGYMASEQLWMFNS